MINLKKNAFTLAEVLIAKREREKMSLLNLFRANELKAPSSELRKQFAFTLAEVLITLAIIGVVAAMTIPILISSYQKTQTVSQFKKAYSGLSQSIAASKAENGDPSGWNWGTGADINAETTYFAETYILPYLKVIKNCNYIAIASNSCSNYSIYYLDQVTPIHYSQGYYVVLSDGTSLDMMTEHYATYDNFWFYIDVNGAKKPNLIGKDIFVLRMQSNSDKLAPYQYTITDRTSLKDNTSWGCNKTATWMAGFFCSNLIMLDSWQIKDDYPW